MRILKKAFEKIKKEEKKYINKEFGAYVLVSKDCVVDVIFDVEYSDYGYVNFGRKKILKLKPHRQDMVKGWFHKHPINGLSGMDIHTIIKLTRFWKECYTLVWQANNKLLCMHTKICENLMTGVNEMVIIEEKEVDIYG